ncbi:MAG TPA: hypothetical protein VGH73_21720 [Thermoanaerobaculia bacterium]
MPARWPRSAALVLALLVPAAGGGAAPAPPPKPPRGITPLTPENERRFEELLRAAEQYRGLKAKQPVAAGSLDVPALKARMTEETGKSTTPKSLKVLETSLKAFGLIPETMDLGRYLPELLSSQVAGYYDPNKKYLALVTPSASPNPGGAPVPDDEEDGKKKIEEDMVMVHELTHALQDQNFDLHRFEDRNLMSDGGMARSALVEGDATLTMLNYNYRMGLESLPGLDAVLAGLMKDPRKMIEETPDLPGAKEMMAAPAWIRDTLLFSYLEGAAFCMDVRGQGGQKLLDYSFREDPPRSTEQILHPEKWYARRDDPVVLHLPDLAKELPGYHKTAEGTLGELTLRIFLRENLQDADWAANAAEGWGGDRFAVYEKNTEKNGERLVVWVTEWDNAFEAGQFRGALSAVGGWRLAPAGPLRVLALLGNLPDERWARVRQRLADVGVDRPVNKRVDFVALGATAPEADERAFRKFRGRIKLLAENTKVLPKGAPSGEVSADGQIYTNQALGVAIQLPDSLRGWKLERDPSSPQILVMISSPNGAIHVGVGYQLLPADTSPATMSRMVERGLQSTLTEFHRLEDIEHSQATLTIRDISFVALSKGQQVRGALRTLARDADFFFLSAIGPADSWLRYQATALRIMNALRFLGTKRPAT